MIQIAAEGSPGTRSQEHGEIIDRMGPPSYKLAYKPQENYSYLVISTKNHRIQPLISQLNAIERGPHPAALYASPFIANEEREIPQKIEKVANLQI